MSPVLAVWVPCWWHRISGVAAMGTTLPGGCPGEAGRSPAHLGAICNVQSHFNLTGEARQQDALARPHPQHACRKLLVQLPWRDTDGMTPCKSEGKKPECTNGQRLVLQ